MWNSNSEAAPIKAARLIDPKMMPSEASLGWDLNVMGALMMLGLFPGSILDGSQCFRQC